MTENMTPDTNPDVTPDPVASEPMDSSENVDLGVEAANTASEAGGLTFNKLADIQDPELRAAVKSYTSKAVNEAKSSWNDKQTSAPADTSKTSSRGSLSRDEVNNMLEQRDEEMRLRYEASARLKAIFSDLGIEEGNSQHQRIVEYYSAEKEAGRIDGSALLSEAGIRSLAHASGALLPDAEGPSSGVGRVRSGLESFETPDMPDQIQLGGKAPDKSSENDPSVLARASMRKQMGG